MSDVGTITIRLEGITFAETERCRDIINELFIRGVFNIRQGSAELHFDHLGILQEIEKKIKWRRNKPDVPLQKILQNAKVEILKQPSPRSLAGL